MLVQDYVLMFDIHLSLFNLITEMINHGRFNFEEIIRFPIFF